VTLDWRTITEEQKEAKNVSLPDVADVSGDAKQSRKLKLTSEGVRRNITKCAISEL